jgi:hypothetical protein
MVLSHVANADHTNPNGLRLIALQMGFWMSLANAILHSCSAPPPLELRQFAILSRLKPSRYYHNTSKYKESLSFAEISKIKEVFGAVSPLLLWFYPL